MDIDILAVICGIIGFLMVLFMVLCFVFRKSIGHDIIGWHERDNITGFDGCSIHGICKYCGKECMKDGQRKLVLGRFYGRKRRKDFYKKRNGKRIM